MNHGAAALSVYGNYSTINKDLDGVILCRVYTLMVAVRLSLYQKGAALYCMVFFISRKTINSLYIPTLLLSTLAGLWAWLDFWQSQFDAPFLECATGVSDSNRCLSNGPTTDWLDQKFMISEAVNFLRHAALECAIPITPTPLSKVCPVEDFWRSTSPCESSDSQS